MLKKSCYILFFILSFKNSLFSQQNIFYSQFYNSPLMLNPALCGNIGDDNFRLNAHARRQWSDLNIATDITDPTDPNARPADAKALFLYETTSGGMDLSLLNKRLGVGMFCIVDKTGGGIYNTMTFSGTLAYHHIMGDNALSIGIQPSYTLSQLDPAIVQRLPIPEPLSSTVSYPELSAGINYMLDIFYIKANIGVSASNLMRTPIRFVSNGPKASLPMQFTAYTNVDWELTDKVHIQPGVFGVMQAGATNFTAGTNLSYKYAEGGTFGNQFIIGLWGRTNNGNLESIIPKFGKRFNKLQLMFSYDYNVAMSKAASSNFFNGLTNTFEISIIFTGKPKIAPPLFEDDFILNPRY